MRARILSLLLLALVLVLVLPRLVPYVSATSGAIFTSQLGFAPGDAKVAVLAVPAGTQVDPTFQIVEVTSGETAYTSQASDVKAYQNGWLKSNASGDTYLLDFTLWPAKDGRFVVESNGLRSLPFEVGESVYDVRRVKPLEFFRIQQSGISVSWCSLDGTCGSHEPDHLDDGRQATARDGGGGDPKLIEQAPLDLPEGRLDVTGGWYDAGDYNAYMGNTPWAAYLLLLTYEEYPAYWSTVDENRDGQPDLLEYTRPALEWMLKMQHGDGSVYERVFSGYGAAFDGRPDLEIGRPLDTDRYADITAKSTYAMAVAYRVFHDSRYLDMATKAWDWAYAHQDLVKPKRHGGGLYFGDVEIGLVLGALELHRAQLADGLVPDPRYLDYARTHVGSHLDAKDWLDPSSWESQQSYALIRYYDLADEADRARILTQLRGRWDSAIQRQEKNAYRMNDEWLYKRFGQNDLSTSGAGDSLWLFDKTGDRKYYDYAVNQLAWLFGRNPFGESWLASPHVGEYTQTPHWRATGKHPIEGVVVPGAADVNGDHLPDYADTGEWYYSEPTINQQAMFVRAMTVLFHAAVS